MVATNQNPKVIQHRKSSIPFSDRAPKVKFLRGTESYSNTQSGPCSPLYGGTSEEQKALKRKKSILKKNAFPILVDLNLLAKGDLENSEDVYTNDKLGNCKVAVDLECQRLYLAERQARGAADIVTFPTAFRIVEPFSRLLGTLYLCLETLDILYHKDFTQIMGRHDVLAIGRAMEECTYSISGCEIKAKKMCVRASEIFKDWSAVIKLKPEFQIEHTKINISLYPKKTMPENVTLYEDIRDEDERYLDDGVVTFSLNHNVILIWSEVTEDGVDLNQAQTFTSMRLEQQCEIIITLVRHVKDLLAHSSTYILNAMKTLTDSDCYDGFENVKKRITELTFDEFFDPLCGLDLKNSLGEVVERKCELLNLAERIFEHFRNTRKIVNKINVYTQQIIKGKKTDACPCLSYFPCGPQFYTKKSIQQDFKSADGISTSVPMSSHFEKIVFTICSPEELMQNDQRSITSSVRTSNSAIDNSYRP